MSRWLVSARVAVLLAIGGCGPTTSATDGESSSSDADTGEDGPGVLDAPILVWEQTPTMCGTADGLLALDGGEIIVVGSSATASGWIRRYDRAGNERWASDDPSPLADVDAGPGDTVWAVGAATVAAYALDGASLGSPAALALPDDVELWAIGRVGEAWHIGGRAGALPTDAFVAEIDATGATIEQVDAPIGDGNVGSWVRSIAGASGIGAACGIVGGGETGLPWLRIVVDGAASVVTGEGNGGLGERTCVDVAVSTEGIARCESGEFGSIVATDVAGDERWAIDTGDARPRAVAWLPDGDLIVAASGSNTAGGSDGWLRRISADGETVWTAELSALGFTVRDVAITDDGAIVMVGDTAGSVGECNVAWVGRYEIPPG